jgi:predicted metal-dependent HD superfamily phosphohydrolase
MSIKSEIIQLLNKLRVNEKCNINKITSDLLNAYGEHHRYYHNLNHIENCFKEFEEIESKLKYPLLTKFALLYHDYIYIPMYSGNEEASGFKAILDAIELGLSETDCGIIQTLICSTTHNEALFSIEDAKFLVDIDLSIFGKIGATIYREEFLEYEKNIRKEFWFINDEKFCRGRIAILKQFINRPRIYLTEYFYSKYENKARENLTYSLGLLDTKIGDIINATNP